ncbi:reverse transcriptase domain-containing protein [Mucilaginibacter galii]|uniref:reverse transcriptase domain-containing protein n=1 Tax=Mucilaginibacter galii TaxID=2005073 RepID=UPI0039EE0CCB
MERLSKSLVDGTFKFSAVRGATLSKKAGKPATALNAADAEIERLNNLRPLRIPDIQDRIIHKALAIRLEALLSETFKLGNECSFAYQSKIGVEHAIVQLGLYYKMGYKYILEADIVKFFDNVVAEDVLKKVKVALPDTTIDKLLDGALKQELSNVEELMSKKVYEKYFQDSENGIPQGNALSPLLANIYLSDFDQRMLEGGYKMVRYADDFIILCKSIDDAKSAYELAKEELEGKLGLTLHPLREIKGEGEKASMIKDPRQHKFNFLSIKFDGTSFTVEDGKVASIVGKLKTLACREDCNALYPHEKVGLFQALKKVSNALEGWIASYAFVNCDVQVAELDNHVNIQLSRLFESYGFELKPSKLRKTAIKGHAKKPLGLTPAQRELSGLPSCISTLEKARRNRLPLNDLLDTLIKQGITNIKNYKSEGDTATEKKSGL